MYNHHRAQLNMTKRIKLIAQNKLIKIFMWFILFLLLLLPFTYKRLYGSPNFQCDSETLVIGMIRAQQEGEYISKYGLGRYYNISGAMTNYHEEFCTNDSETIDGYLVNSNILKLEKNEYTTSLKNASFIVFENGDSFDISDFEEKDDEYGDGYIYITIDAPYQINFNRNGSLINTRFYDINKNELPSFLLSDYVSQYGLQGKIYSAIAKLIGGGFYKEIESLLNIVLTSLIFIAICYCISLKYNNLLALCFYFTFALSPWVANFSSNLYWVEFTWFIPMLIGLICSININNKKIRIVSYILAFTSILVKCLCGYEYLSTIMMGLIMFPVCDLVECFFKKKKMKFNDYLKPIILLSISAFLGFVLAIIIHSVLRGNGNILNGIKSIWENDVVRRTYGGSRENFDKYYWQSFDASMFSVIKTYFNFNTDIIKGIPAKMFKPLCLFSLIALIFNLYKQKNNSIRDIILYVFSFFTSLSWFVLAKSHSYMHTHMNYVLWYFGFIQIVFYIIIKTIIYLIKDIKKISKSNSI